jgi:nitroreductase
MSDIAKVILERQSSRGPFDPNRSVPKEILAQILEAGRWAPTAHNMQNFHVVVVDDKVVLGKIGTVTTRISEVFLRENYANLSFSEEELTKKKVGILSVGFPPSWVNPSKMAEVANESTPMPLTQILRGSPLLLVVLYDSTRRAPASEGDIFGFMSLGCVMENMWLMAQSLGVSLQVLAIFAMNPMEAEIKQILNVPSHLKIAYACRLGYLASSIKYPRVRRNTNDFVHLNKYENKEA